MPLPQRMIDRQDQKCSGLRTCNVTHAAVQVPQTHDMRDDSAGGWKHARQRRQDGLVIIRGSLSQLLQSAMLYQQLGLVGAALGLNLPGRSHHGHCRLTGVGSICELLLRPAHVRQGAQQWHMFWYRPRHNVPWLGHWCQAGSGARSSRMRTIRGHLLSFAIGAR